jgi:hypothetical protein
VTSKVKPGMMLCDASVMSLVLRQQAKFEYLDFQRQKEETLKHRKRVSEVKTTVPSAQISKQPDREVDRK